MYTEPTAGVKSQFVCREAFELLSVHPNPFNTRATVTVRLKRPGNVRLTLYNLLRQEVRTLIDEHFAAGRHEISLDGSSLASGTYFLRVTTAENAATRKVKLVR
ncbi:MAG: hypothetical protein MAG453_01029 [Calditrichaeota bacterium]|nr:hypothetical protein [Calditrichota bacterium]